MLSMTQLAAYQPNVSWLLLPVAATVDSSWLMC